MTILSKTLTLKENNYLGFIHLVSESKTIKSFIKTVIVDIKIIKFIKPFHLVMLACMIEELHQRNIKCKIIENLKITNYFDTIKIHKYWQVGFDRDNFTSVANSTTLCLWHISKSMIDQYVIHASKYYQRKFFKGKDLDALSINLSEVFNNIFDHSESKIQGYVITQFYPKKHELIISICDFGIGIANKVNNYNKNNGGGILPDNEAIILALEDGFSTHSTIRNRGFGLATVRNIVKSMNGTLQIVSNYGSFFSNYRNNMNDTSFILKTPIQGTLINVRLNTTKFDNVEEEVSDVLDF